MQKISTQADSKDPTQSRVKEERSNLRREALRSQYAGVLWNVRAVMKRLEEVQKEFLDNSTRPAQN
jgi:hypothetical protein